MPSRSVSTCVPAEEVLDVEVADVAHRRPAVEQVAHAAGRTLSGTPASSAPSMISSMSCWSAVGMANSTSSAW